MWRNRAKCRNCGDTIESKTQHDFVSCTCWKEGQRRMNEFRDKYYRKDTEKVKISNIEYEVVNIDYDSMYEDPKYKEICELWGRGFFLDGGRDKLGARFGGNFEDMDWKCEDECE